MTVRIDPSDAIGEIATRYPESIPCFERWHLDFPSRGERSLSLACKEEGVDCDRLLDELLQAPGDSAPEIDWTSRPLAELTQRLMDHYHISSRERLARMQGMAMQLVAEHGSKSTELARLRKLLEALHNDLFPHMLKEETILFPWVERLSLVEADEPIDRPFFGTIRNPVNMMALEHGYVVELLGEVRHLTNDFQPPDESDDVIRTLYEELEEFEHMQRLHIHLENNIFFPRAIDMEDRVQLVGELK